MLADIGQPAAREASDGGRAQASRTHVGTTKHATCAGGACWTRMEVTELSRRYSNPKTTSTIDVTTAALLQEIGHEVVVACDGTKMLDLLRAAPSQFDLIIRDYAMPLISGAEGIRQAREICTDIPAVLITGYAEAASVSGRPSDVHILLKPFGAEQFATAIASAINRRSVAIAAE